MWKSFSSLKERFKCKYEGILKSSQNDQEVFQLVGNFFFFFQILGCGSVLVFILCLIRASIFIFVVFIMISLPIDTSVWSVFHLLIPGFCKYRFVWGFLLFFMQILDANSTKADPSDKVSYLRSSQNTPKLRIIV